MLWKIIISGTSNRLFLTIKLANFFECLTSRHPGIVLVLIKNPFKIYIKLTLK